jgi:hypothetical protein
MVPIPADPRWILEDEKQRIHADDLFNWCSSGEEVFCFSPLTDEKAPTTYNAKKPRGDHP